ncbi:MAG: hypothetical protein AB2L20_12295 [Mangrovibacterium sp.]
MKGSILPMLLNIDGQHGICYQADGCNKEYCPDKSPIQGINLEYKMINIDFNGLIWVRLENDLCGILNWENEFVIPPEYSYLSYIEDGDLKGCYQATKGDLSGIINLENKFILH